MRRLGLSVATLAILSTPACAKMAGPASRGMASPADAASSMAGGEAAGMEMAAPVDAEADDGYDRNIQAGLLTAGTFDDTLNKGVLQQFARSMADNQATRELAQSLAGPITVVKIIDAKGKPMNNVRVTVGANQRRAGKTLRSRTDGRVVILGDWDLRGHEGSEFSVQATFSGQRKRITVRQGSTDTLQLPVQAPRGPRALDVALVIDATGSMGDELEYLKVEIRNIADEIARAHPQVDQRYSLVVYRDEGDAYVTRPFNFTQLARFHKRLGRQHAGGGGDYPEAMDRALGDAAQLSWRDDNAAKVMFLVADAPPHPERMHDSLLAAEELRGQGVAMYPVAASGVASEAELVMRATAVMSGGQYIFLTDDSGVGLSHEEPHIPCYTVQSLRDAMLRAIETELQGHRVEADPKRTIREVGRSQGGTCVSTKPKQIAEPA